MEWRIAPQVEIVHNLTRSLSHSADTTCVWIACVLHSMFPMEAYACPTGSAHQRDNALTGTVYPSHTSVMTEIPQRVICAPSLVLESVYRHAHMLQYALTIHILTTTTIVDAETIPARETVNAWNETGVYSVFAMREPEGVEKRPPEITPLVTRVPLQSATEWVYAEKGNAYTNNFQKRCSVILIEIALNTRATDPVATHLTMNITSSDGQSITYHGITLIAT